MLPVLLDMQYEDDIASLVIDVFADEGYDYYQLVPGLIKAVVRLSAVMGDQEAVLDQAAALLEPEGKEEGYEEWENEGGQ